MTCHMIYMSMHSQNGRKHHIYVVRLFREKTKKVPCKVLLGQDLSMDDPSKKDGAMIGLDFWALGLFGALLGSLDSQFCYLFVVPFRKSGPIIFVNCFGGLDLAPSTYSCFLGQWCK